MKKYMGDDETLADLYCADRLSDVPSNCEADISENESAGR
jgi:hypothetical protein